MVPKNDGAEDRGQMISIGALESMGKSSLDDGDEDDSFFDGVEVYCQALKRADSATVWRAVLRAARARGISCVVKRKK